MGSKSDKSFQFDFHVFVIKVNSAIIIGRFNLNALELVPIL